MRYAYLVLICIAVSLASAADFQRPWENATWLSENPNIYDGWLWWNIPEFDKTLDSMDADGVAGLHLNGTAKTNADAALREKSAAENALGACLVNMSSLWPKLAFPVLLSYDVLTAFSNVPTCRSYGEIWRSSVDSALLATEASLAEAGRSVENARAGWEEIKRLGLCNRNYTRSGSEPCAGMQSAFIAVDNNVTEGAYGKYPLALSEARRLQSDLMADAPSLARYGVITALVWGQGGVLDSFNALSASAHKAESDAEAGYRTLLEAAQVRKAAASGGLAAARAQRLDLITKAAAGYEAQEAGSVSERLAAVEARNGLLSQSLTDATLLHADAFTDGHLANSINGMAGVADGYAALEADIAALQEDGRTATEQQREEARIELDAAGGFIRTGARSSESLVLYDEAASYFQAGEGAAAYGAKFTAYYKAAERAREVRSAQGYGMELETKAMLEQLRALIAAAKADDINVATEEASLDILANAALSGAEIRDAANASTSSIIRKARLRYGDDLAVARARLLDKLALAGPDAADLYTDLYRSENGIIRKDGSVSYPEAIGKLKKLQEDYAALEGTLDAYMGTIVGNSMSVSASPLVEDAKPDAPATIILDAVLENARNYAARNVTAKVSMAAPLEFVYSDITAGRDEVGSLRMADGGRTILLSFASVGPFQARHVILQKQAVVVHTLGSEMHAEGTGDGAASVSASLEFGLDTAVRRLALPFGNAVIDGASYNPGNPGLRLLAPGRHLAVAQYVVSDAYDENHGEFKAYQVGINSRMEYDIEISPHMDLDSALIFVDNANGSGTSGISTFTIVAATGELVKDRSQVSPSQYSARVVGLRKDRPVVLHVSYIVDNTEAYVRSETDLLYARNLTNNSREALAQARIQLETGNYTGALELVEQAKGMERDAVVENAKLQKKYDELAGKLSGELDDLNAALATNATGPFMDKLSARQAEIELVLGGLPGLPLDQQVAALGKVDYGWMDAALGTLRKDSYKEYNALKERFFNAGNSSTPEQFLGFEAALNRLETGGRLQCGVDVVRALEGVRAVVAVQEAGAGAARETLRAEVAALKSEVLGIQDHYLREAGVAKGTEYAGFFTETSQTLAKKIKDAEDSVGGDSRVAEAKMADLNRTKEKLAGALDALESEAEARLALVKSLLAGANLDSAKRADLEAKAGVMEGMLNSGEYVNALRAGASISKEIDSAGKGSDNSLLLLGITALAILAVVAAYIIKQQELGGGGRGRPLRPLRRLGESVDGDADASHNQSTPPPTPPSTPPAASSSVLPPAPTAACAPPPMSKILSRSSSGQAIPPPAMPGQDKPPPGDVPQDGKRRV